MGVRAPRARRSVGRTGAGTLVTPARTAAIAALSITLTALIVLGALAFAAAPAAALPAYVHGSAQACASCHHTTPSSFASCSSCHADASVPNQVCIACHPGKTTSGSTCWACHAPGQVMPPPTDTACAGCHGDAPHLGSSPACTSCHGVDPTPHHDAVDQVAPTSCVSCHRHADQQTHGTQDCGACHATDVHPSYPVVPDACNVCHAAATFGTLPCLVCHDGTPFNGVSDDDIHDQGIPDPPISGTSCDSCHAGAEQHAGAVDCVGCHTEATAFHHGQAASPGYPACTDCHAQKQQHGDGLACQDCHEGAQHQSDPPTPSSSVCSKCHAVSVFGTRDCYRCHTPPVYHVVPSVGSCSSCHGTSRSYHAGKVSCGTCHVNVRSGHHVGSVSSKSCTSRGCHAQQKHVGQVWCTRCHGRAQHDRTPLNLPADTWSVCQRCHTFTSQALANGVPACSECHDTTQHVAAYRVEPCTDCHENQLHQDRVPCASCHLDPGPGHHRVGAVGARDCSDCHLSAEVHASGTAAGSTNTCASCHPGSIHGVLGQATDASCRECHETADLHSDGFGCTDCHWPAVHVALPDAAKYGARAPLPLNDRGSERTPEPEQRDEYPASGADLVLIFGIAVALLAVGLLLRLSVRRSQRRGPPDD